MTIYIVISPFEELFRQQTPSMCILGCQCSSLFSFFYEVIQLLQARSYFLASLFDIPKISTSKLDKTFGPIVPNFQHYLLLFCHSSVIGNYGKLGQSLGLQLSISGGVLSSVNIMANLGIDNNTNFDSTVANPVAGYVHPVASRRRPGSSQKRTSGCIAVSDEFCRISRCSSKPPTSPKQISKRRGGGGRAAHQRHLAAAAATKLLLHQPYLKS